MYKKIVYIVKTKLHYYPPCMAQIRILNKLGVDIEVIYGTSDQVAIDILNNEGIKNKKIGNLEDKNTQTKLGKLKSWYDFRRSLKRELKKYDSETIFWFGTAESILPLKWFIEKKKYICSFLELADESILKKILLKNIARNALSTTACEETRGYIMKYWWNLNKLPYIFPNKPYEMQTQNRVLPTCDVTKNIIEQLIDKKVILYQGIIQNTEEIVELAKALKSINSDYYLVLMGIDKYNSFDRLKEIYDKTIFIDYISAPLHLEVTSYARIGVAFYRNDSLNKAFCAPNKIYEYSGLGIPIIGNNVPGLTKTVGAYKAAVCVEFSENNLIKAIDTIETNYDEFSKNAVRFYNDTDNFGKMRELIKEVGLRSGELDGNNN